MPLIRPDRHRPEWLHGHGGPETRKYSLFVPVDRQTLRNWWEADWRRDQSPPIRCSTGNMWFEPKSQADEERRRLNAPQPFWLALALRA